MRISKWPSKLFCLDNLSFVISCSYYFSLRISKWIESKNLIFLLLGKQGLVNDGDGIYLCLITLAYFFMSSLSYHLGPFGMWRISLKYMADFKIFFRKCVWWVFIWDIGHSYFEAVFPKSLCDVLNIVVALPENWKLVQTQAIIQVSSRSPTSIY